MARRGSVKPTIDLSAQKRVVEQRAADSGVPLEAEPFSYAWYAKDWPTRKGEFMEREFMVSDAFDGKKLKPFRLNFAQRELLAGDLEAARDRSRQNVSLKCRRLGISTYYCASYLADCLFESNQHALIVAHDPDTLQELLETVKLLYGNLRDEVRPKAGYDSKYELSIEDRERGVTGSRIRLANCTPGKENKGRGTSISRLHLTEVPFWLGDQKKFLTSVLDAAKGGIVSWESTAGGVGDEFYRVYQKGRSGSSKVISHFFEWWWNPNYRVAGARFFQDSLGNLYLLPAGVSGRKLSSEELEPYRLSEYDEEFQKENELPLVSERTCGVRIAEFLRRFRLISSDSGWVCDEVAERLQWRREEVEEKGALKFRIEQPEDDRTAFSSTGGGVFEESYLKVTGKFRQPEAGHQYVVVLDPANGIPGRDPAAIQVIDVQTLEQVYEWAADTEKQDLQAARVCELSDLYNGATIVIESNMGEAAILEVERLGYGERLYRYIDVQTQRDIDAGKIGAFEAWEKARPGLPMSDRLKRLMVNQFEKLWRSGQFIAASEELVAEARVFVQVGNALKAKDGYHDDRIMAAMMGCWWALTSSDSVGFVGVMPETGGGA
jgi:hypothetical protein